MKRHIGQGLGESQAQELLSLWSQGAPPSRYICQFTGEDAPLSPDVQPFDWSFIT